METFSQKGVIEVAENAPPKLENYTNNNKLTITNNGLQLGTTSYYYNWGTARSNVSVSQGTWYYEATLTSRNSSRIGWCTKNHNPQNQNPLGCDEESWAVDQNQKYHKSDSGVKFGDGSYWSNGDVIGTLLDFDRRRIIYYHNGKEIGIAFENIPKSISLMPAISVSYDTKITVNFGPTFRNQPLGSFGVNPSVTSSQKQSLEGVFKKFDPENDGEIHAESGGLLQLLQQFGSTGPEDPLPIILAWKFHAGQQWLFTKEEWMTTWALEGSHTLDKMKASVKKWREDLKDDFAFRNFYSYVFDYLKSPNATVIEAVEAVQAWKMCELHKDWKYWDLWEKYWTSGKLKGINKDSWLMLLRFIKKLGNDVNNYSEDDCWPSVIDDFVFDWLKKD